VDSGDCDLTSAHILYINMGLGAASFTPLPIVDRLDLKFKEP